MHDVLSLPSGQRRTQDRPRSAAFQAEELQQLYGIAIEYQTDRAPRRVR